MGHRSHEKKSHKHKHHRSEKRSRKKSDKIRYENPKESEPESGEIVEEVVRSQNQGEGGGVKVAGLSEVGAKKVEKGKWNKENGELGGAGAPCGKEREMKDQEDRMKGVVEDNPHNSKVENGQVPRVSKEACEPQADGSPSSTVQVCEVQVNGNSEHIEKTGNGQSQSHEATHQSPPSSSQEPMSFNPPVQEEEHKKHSRSRPSPSSEIEPVQNRDHHRQRRKSTRKREVVSRSRSRTRSRSRSSERHRKDYRERHHYHHRRMHSPGLELEIIRKRPRSRSRSRSGGGRDRGMLRHRSVDRSFGGRNDYSERSRRRRRSSPDCSRKRSKRSSSGGRRSRRTKRAREEEESDDDEEYKARVQAALADTMAEEDEDRLTEERRKRRQEILNKYKKQAAAPVKNSNASPLNGDTEMPPIMDFGGPTSSPNSAPSAADPLLLESPEENECAAELNNSSAQETQCLEVTEKKSEDEQNHCTEDKASAPVDDGDIFCDTPDTSGRKLAEGLDEAVRKASTQKGLTDAYDDPEGYYNFQIGEILDNRYEVFASKGKGVFSTVLRARDKGRRNPDNEHPEVAIKMIRSNDVMKRSGQTEEEILKMLAVSDPENKRHCIRLLRSFEYRGHLCLVFEPMAMNLRELTNKFGRKVGLNIDAVGHYTAQLLVALKHLKNNKILHADIKPDNILVNEKFSRVKLCDFGSAMRQGDVEVTPYLVSRFYRSPEVILGLKYDHPMDLWSIGCVIYELFTGKILFPGKTNNEMLKLMMEVKGAFPKKMLKKGEFADRHFENDPNMSFVQYDDDPVTKKPIKRLIVNPTVKNSFSTLLLRNSLGSKRELVLDLADLLERMMMLDPERRINLDMALRHPFVRHYLQRNKTTESSIPAAKPAPRKP